MGNYSIKILDSVENLVANAEAWNSLWSRTSNASPLARAECIALWMRRFVPDSPFRAVMVESDGLPVAGVPLYLQRRAKVLRCGVLPRNCWGACGDLLCNASRQDSELIFYHLVRGLKQLSIDFFWCEGIRHEGFPWKNFREHWQEKKYVSHTIPQWYTAMVSLHGDPETVVAAWGKKELADIKRRFRKRYTPDNHEFRVVSNPDEIAALLPDCFAIENASWKGQEGSGGSIIKMDMTEYFLTQARMLAEQDLIRLYTLFVDGRLIAFQYNYRAEKTVFCMKIGYDPSMREFAPGMVLQWFINQSLLDDPNVDYFDFSGIAGTYQKIWNPELHAVAQVVFPLSLRGRVALSLYKLYNNMKSRVRWRASSDSSTKKDVS